MLLRKKPFHKAPQVGDYRVEIKYAYFPVRTDTGLIWLEWYKRIWEYAEYYHVTGYPVPGYVFRSRKWFLRQVKRRKQL